MIDVAYLYDLWRWYKTSQNGALPSGGLLDSTGCTAPLPGHSHHIKKILVETIHLIKFTLCGNTKHCSQRNYDSLISFLWATPVCLITNPFLAVQESWTIIIALQRVMPISALIFKAKLTRPWPLFGWPCGLGSYHFWFDKYAGGILMRVGRMSAVSERIN
jgi:hypothetical protein